MNNYDDSCCSCNPSEYCNNDIGHIVTGNLNIILHNELRRIMTYGPSYRIPHTLIWNNVLNEVHNSINDCIIKWSKNNMLMKRYSMNGEM